MQTVTIMTGSDLGWPTLDLKPMPAAHKKAFEIMLMERKIKNGDINKKIGQQLLANLKNER